jgi:hypothetical protein
MHALLSLLVILAISSQALCLTPAWVDKSNQNAHLLLAIAAKYSPEGAGSTGMNGLDERILGPNFRLKCTQAP